jgi:hypothetical protein
LARAIGDRRSEVIVLGDLGALQRGVGALAGAQALLEQQLALARELGDRRGEGAALWNLALTVDDLGDRARALDLARGALVILQSLESPEVERISRQLASWGQASAAG